MPTPNIHMENEEDIAGRAADDLRKGAYRIKNDAGATASAVKEDMEGLSRRAGQRLHDMAGAAEHRAADMAEATVDKVRDRPLQSIAVAAGVGFLFGLLCRR